MVEFFFQAIGIAVIFLLGCVGETLTEKSGHLNLGIPGIMCVGAAGGILGVVVANNANGFLSILLAVIFAAVFAAIAGGIYAFLTVTLRCNQNVTGLALTIFGNGFSSVFNNNIIKIESDGGPSAMLSEAGNKFFLAHLPFSDSLGWFGKIFLGHGALIYVAIAIAVVAAIVLRFTRIGLNLRAVGESPATADAAGINVTAYKYAFILIGSAIAGLGGMLYVMQLMHGIVGAELAGTIEGIGWLCVALVIFTLWKPALAILGSFIFGALYIFPSFLNVFFPEATFTFAQLKLFPLIPYVATIIVLVVTSIIGNKENQAPAALGLSYFREDR